MSIPIASVSSSSIDISRPSPLVPSSKSVKELRQVWEQMARQNGWEVGEGSAWVTSIRTRKFAAKTVIDDGMNVDSDLRVNEEGGGHSEIGDGFETLDNAEGSSTGFDDSMAVEKATAHLPVGFPQIWEKCKKANNCDMIVCEVRTRTVDGRKIHEIDLNCMSCSSSFVLTAMHECGEEEEGNVEEGGVQEQSSMVSGYGAGTLASSSLKDQRGLQWLRDDEGKMDCVNIII
ncbi:hypothetical protein HDU76_011145 [Blyttiomyces sp. JEL0837]|nr:hypothetical protein HDU76_011145 [Blyttiomyces sp. JEL0837]